MICTKCGSKIDDGVKFCANCGEKIEGIFSAGNGKKSLGKRIFLIIISLLVLVVVVNYFRLYYARIAVDQGNSAYEQGLYDTAIANYTRAIKLGYEKDSNLFWRGRAYYGKLEFDMAIADFTDTLNLYPDDYECYFWRGRAYYEKLEFDMAMADFTSAINLRPDDYVCYLWRGRAYGKKYQYTLAIVDFTDAIKLDSDNSYGGHIKFVERGDVYFAIGDYDGAMLDYDRAIAEIDTLITERLQLHMKNPEEGWDDNNELYQWRDEAVARKSNIEATRLQQTQNNNIKQKGLSYVEEVRRSLEEAINAIRGVFEGE